VFGEVTLHPEVLKGLEILHYHVEHNLPVEKELLFKLVPELFVREINKLDWRDRKRFEKPKLAYLRADGDTLEVDERHNLALNQLSAHEQLQDKSMRMEWYLYEQTHDLYDFYFHKLRDEVLHGGHVGMEEYLMMLDQMDEENMKGWEKRLMAEIKELRLIKEDIAALNLHLAQQADMVVIPDWI